jgi:opacity protein-like surface antigen
MARYLLLTIILSASCAVTGIAQTACELTLAKAQEEFDAGRFYSVPGILKDCLEKNQSRGWEQRAYLLLAETYLLLEDAANADDSYLKVLRANPEFITDETRDPIDLVYLSKRFTATPVLSFYGRLGLNWAFVHVINDVRVAPQGEVKESYTPEIGWQGGGGVEYHYNDNFSVAAEVNIAFTSFSHRSRGLFDDNYTGDFRNRQTWLSVPLSVRYTFDRGQLRPFAFVGYSYHLLMADKGEFVINSNTESPVVDLIDTRSKTNGSLVFGGGLKYKWGLRYLFGDVRYSAGLRNVASPGNRLDEFNETGQWVYADDDFRLNNLSISVGYVHPLYKPRKLKKARTKSILRRIGRRDNAAD